MKKLLLISLVGSSLLFADYSSSTFKRAKEEKKQYKSDSVSADGYIYNVRSYRDYDEISIETKDNGRIRYKSKYKGYYKEGHKISGNCSNEEYGYYKNCIIFQGSKVR